MANNMIYFDSRDELLRVDVNKIVYFEADGNYTNIMMVNKLKGTVCMNLGQMEEAIANQLGDQAQGLFMRIGRRHIINTRYIYSINVLRQHLVLSDYDHFAFQISVSKPALRQIKELVLANKRK